MSLTKTIKAYFWPSSLNGIRSISKKGQEIGRQQIECYRKGHEYNGPRCAIGDDAIRASNRRIVGPWMNTFIRRWAVLAVFLFCIAWCASLLGWWIVEVPATLGTVAALCIAMFLTWLRNDMHKSENN